MGPTTPQSPIIETPRLLLRPLSLEDAEDIFEFMSLPSVAKFTTRNALTSIDQVTTFLSDRTGPDNYNFAVVLPSNELPEGKVIGILGSHNVPYVGYLFHPAHGGKGYATEALEAFVEGFFQLLPSSASTSDIGSGVQAYDFIQARVDVENTASIRLLERVGFVRGETTKSAYTSAQLGLRDDFTYRLPRPGMTLEGIFESMRAKEDEARPVPDIM